MKCKKGFKGNCCCNCKSQITLYCHPWNKTFGKGSISKICGYVCIAELDFEISYSGIFSDKKHGCCEMYSKK